MRSTQITAAALLMALAMVPSGAMADANTVPDANTVAAANTMANATRDGDTEARSPLPELVAMEQQLSEIEARIRETEQQLEAANTSVSSQQQILDAAGLASERGQRSRLSEFIESIDMTSWVATSYNYNFKGTDSDFMAAGGQNSSLPHHPNPNTFQLDQFWIEIDRPANEESRGLFHLDIAAGIATDLPGMTPSVFSAYVGYLAPLYRGIEVKAGQLPTLLGGEVVQTNGNFNITRGVVWGLQPTTNLGVVFSGEITSGLSLALGFLNNPIGNDLPGGFDVNSGKALTSQLAWVGESYGALLGLNYGEEIAPGSIEGTKAGVANDYTMLLDLLLTADPLDNLSFWLNFDYKRVADDPIPSSTFEGVSDSYGLAIAARVGILDATGYALRFEYLREADRDAEEVRFYSLTVTLDHGLAEALTLKAEYRFDYASDSSYNGSSLASAGTVSSSHIGLLQLMYQF